MTDVPPGGTTSNGGAHAIPPSGAAHAPFPGVRLLYALGFAFVAWFVFWILLLLGAVQFAMFLINGRLNDELKGFSFSLVQYLWELVAFIVFVSDDQPFPIGPFPKQK